MPRTITNPGTGSLMATHPSNPWSSLSDSRQKERIDVLRSTIIQDLQRAWILDHTEADPQGRLPIYFFDGKGALEAACREHDIITKGSRTRAKEAGDLGIKLIRICFPRSRSSQHPGGSVGTSLTQYLRGVEISETAEFFQSRRQTRSKDNFKITLW